MSQLPVNRNFPPQHFPLSATLLPHIYFKLSTSTLLLTHSPLLYFYLKLFPQISVVAPRTVNLIRGRYLLWGEHITMLFHCWRKIQHRTQILRFIEKFSFLFGWHFSLQRMDNVFSPEERLKPNEHFLICTRFSYLDSQSKNFGIQVVYL